MALRAMLVSLFWFLAGCVGAYEPTGPQEGPGSGEPMGSGGGGDTPAPEDPAPPAPTPSYTVAVDPAVGEMVLGETKSFAVTVTGENGFSGAVTLAVSGLPSSWNVQFSPAATVDVPRDGVANATMVVSIPTDAEAAAASASLVADASAGQRTAPIELLVKPELVVRIPPNALDNPSMSFGGSLRVRYFAPGTKITWVNDDTINHRIHGNGAGGLEHQAENLQPGGSYSVILTAPGVYEYGCHIHPQMTGQLVVTDSP